jgi:hypothetical protein
LWWKNCATARLSAPHGETRSYQFVQTLKNYSDDKIINRTGFEIESMPNEERGSVLSTILRHTEFWILKALPGA